MDYPKKLKNQLKSIIGDTLNVMHDRRSEISPNDFSELTSYVEDLETSLFKLINKGDVSKDILSSLPTCHIKSNPSLNIAYQLRKDICKAIVEFRVDCI